MVAEGLIFNLILIFYVCPALFQKQVKTADTNDLI